MSLVRRNNSANQSFVNRIKNGDIIFLCQCQKKQNEMAIQSDYKEVLL